MTDTKADPTLGHEEGGPNDDTLRAKVVSLRPREHVEAERLENAIAEAMFGVSSDPTRIDRFVILGRLGAGGMGVVYSAYDPRLDRRVALKLLRDSQRVGRVERERLLREAHALARISHPNVVTVHEVGELDDQVFVVMEFVVGQSLDQWAKAMPRSPARVLEVYRQAGRGLAAVHAAGLVHRDFKPHNAVIGDDGRVRVVDFGLARGDLPPEGAIEGAPHDASISSASSSSFPTEISKLQLDAVLTRPDALVGTPAYMSPEQYAGRRVGPASDQFSFCVSLYQALTDEHPFAASTPVEQATRIIEGDLREPRLRTGLRPPAWMLAVVRRGMSVDPGRRFASMDELLAALARDPARTRRRWLGGLALGALVGLSGYAMLQEPTAALPCQGSEAALAEVWNDARRETLHERFSTLVSDPETNVQGARVIDTLDGYAERWRSMHEDACLAHHRGEQSGALLDKRMACLARRRAALESGFEVLSNADVTTFENAAFLVHDLPPVHMCGDLDVLEAELPVPEDPKVAVEVASIRDGLTRAIIQTNGGRYEQADAIAVRLEARARVLGYAPLIAEALLVKGRLEMEHDRGNAKLPSATLQEAFETAIASRNDAVAAEAWVRRLFVEAIRPDGRTPNDEDTGLARALLERLADPSRIRGLFLNNAGNIAASRGEYDIARDLLRRALEVRQSQPEPNPIELLETRFNLALMASNDTAQLAGLQLATEGFERELGPAHPRTMMTRMTLIGATKDIFATETTLPALCADYRRLLPGQIDAITACDFELAMRSAELGEVDHAIEILEQITELLDFPDPPPLITVRRATASGYAALFAGRHEEAIEILQAAAAKLGEVDLPPWLEVYIADLHLVLGRSLLAVGRRLEAVAELQRAIDPLDRIAGQRIDQGAQRMLARARLAQAQALLGPPLLEDPSARERARLALEGAARWYRDAGRGYANRRAETERSLALVAR